jgi:hypothetical protein
MDGETASQLRKQESTLGLVSEIKNKIQILKEKKENDKESSKNNELDIEVSKEFLNKFRKSKTFAEEDRANSSSSQIKKDIESKEQQETKKLIEDYKTIEKFKSFDCENQGATKNYVSYKKERSSSPLMNFAKQSGLELNSSFDYKKDEKKISKPLIDYEIQNLANKKPTKSFLSNFERYPEDK